MSCENTALPSRWRTDWEKQRHKLGGNYKGLESEKIMAMEHRKCFWEVGHISQTWWVNVDGKVGNGVRAHVFDVRNQMDGEAMHSDTVPWKGEGFRGVHNELIWGTMNLISLYLSWVLAATNTKQPWLARISGGLPVHQKDRRPSHWKHSDKRKAKFMWKHPVVDAAGASPPWDSHHLNPGRSIFFSINVHNLWLSLLFKTHRAKQKAYD